MKSIKSYGDRYGSRYALLASLLVFALVTIGSAIGAAPKPVFLLKTQSARIHWWFRSLGDSLRSWLGRQAERARSPEANSEPAPRCC